MATRSEKTKKTNIQVADYVIGADCPLRVKIKRQRRIHKWLIMPEL